MELTGSKILVIGGGGFIGSHLVDELVKTDVGEIVVYDNFCRGRMENLVTALKDRRVSVFEAGGDIRDMDILGAAIRGKDYVFHLAALWLLQCYDYPGAAFETNIAGTFNVLEACVTHNVKRLVYSSSASVYGDAVQIPMTESHPFNNRTFYGATKIAGEQMCRAFHSRYGLDYVGLRYMNVYGERQDYRGAYVAVIMKVLDQIAQGIRPTIYGDGSQTYDFVYVEDVARSNILAMQADITDEFYNVGMGKVTTIKELVELILELTGSELKCDYLPATQSFVTNRVGSVVKAWADLGFEAKVDLREGLKRLIEWRCKDASTVD